MKNTSKLLFLKNLETLDYNKLGLVCGIEIHQQLNTPKLFSPCPSKIVPNEELDKEISRKLRFSLSEKGTVDRAALDEFKKGKYNVYKYNDEIASLVDLDEEPPKGPQEDALKTALQVGFILNLNFFDKLQFMRKLIIDGSVTSGFQRTAMLGFGGSLKLESGEVSIDGINLEEDSCRIIERNKDHSIFALDRQGIPLIEITTGPHIYSPTQAKEVALTLGNILRSFKTTRRGLGTIRQDLNISIAKGTRVELKGVQNLKLVPKIIEAEVKRQAILVSICEELKQKGVTKSNFSDSKIYDLTECFKGSSSEVIKTNLKEKGSKVLGIKLYNFKGILGHELHPNYRFASEISTRNKKLFPSIKGLFHSDELPNYGIEEEEVQKVRKELKLKDSDSFILIAQEIELAKKSLEQVLTIVKDLMRGVVEEVRQVDPKGTLTTFLRPMPGSARMYPETDIGEIELTKDFLKTKTKDLPELYDLKIQRLSSLYGLEHVKVENLLSKFEEQELTILLKAANNNAKNLYSLLFDLPKDIKKREQLEPVDFKAHLLEDLLKTAKKENLNQKTIRDIFISLYKEKLQDLEDLKTYLENNNLLQKTIDESEIERKVKEICEKNKGAPFGALMGIAMKEFKGNVDGKKVSSLLKKFS